jgi:epsilon-lactone hydrolase
MRSWQVRLMELYFRLKRTFSPESGEPDLQKERAELEGLGAMFNPPKGTKFVTELAGGVPAEWLIPPCTDTGRVVLYLHGGSYVSGSINSHRPLASNIALACKARVLIIDYRLAPEHPYPAAVEDAMAVYKWLINDRVDPRHLAVVGDSAGGGLTIALLISLRDGKVPLPAAGICLSPWTDLAFTGETWNSKAANDLVIYARKEREFAKHYHGNISPQSPLVSPLYADLKGLPPLLIQVGTDEVLLSDSRGLVDRAQQAGVNAIIDEWEKMQHVWQFAAGFIPEGRRAIARIGEFIDRWL